MQQLGPIAEYSGAAARSELGHAEVVFTIPAESVQEAADGLGMTRRGVLKAIKGKVLPATRVGGTWLLQRSVVEGVRARRGA